MIVSGNHCGHIHANGNLLLILMWEYSHNFLVVNVLKFVTGPAAIRYICTSYTCLDNGIFLGHCMFMTNTFCKLFAFLLINQCIMKISFAYLHEYFKSYGTLKFKICRNFVCRYTYFCRPSHIL